MANGGTKLDCWRCPRCDYDLSATRDAHGAHCPECGGIFSLGQLRDATDRMERHAARLKLWVFALPLVCAGFGLVGDEILWRAAIGSQYGLLAVATFVGCAYAVSVVSLVRSDDAPIPWLTAIPMALVIASMNIVIVRIIGLVILLVVSLMSL